MTEALPEVMSDTNSRRTNFDTSASSTLSVEKITCFKDLIPVAERKYKSLPILWMLSLAIQPTPCIICSIPKLAGESGLL